MATLLDKFKRNREGDYSLPSFQNGGSWDKLNTKQRRSYIENFLRKKGLNDIQLYAVLGNLEQENGNFDTKLTNGIGATGIAQWHEGRAEQLYKRKNPQHIDTQLEHLWDEISGKGGHWTNKSGGKDAFFKAKNLAEATKIFRVDFERPGEKEAFDDKRLKYAVNASKGRFKLSPDFKVDYEEPITNSFDYTTSFTYDPQKEKERDAMLYSLQAQSLANDSAKINLEVRKIEQEALEKKAQDEQNRKEAEDRALQTKMEQEQMLRESAITGLVKTLDNSPQIDLKNLVGGSAQSQPFQFTSGFNFGQKGGVIESKMKNFNLDNFKQKYNI